MININNIKMERKLIKQGMDGYTIYLPKKWIDKKGLKQGDNVTIIETDTSLVIGSPVTEKREISIKITEDNRKEIKNILTHLYRVGFDSIILENTDSKLLQEVKQAKELLLGFELTDITKSSIKLENISEPTEQKYDVLLRRIFLIIKETLSIISKVAEKSRFSSMKEIEELRKQLDKFVLFCRRILSKEKYEKNLALGWELLTFLMHINHSAYYLYKYCNQSGFKSDEEVILLTKKLEEYFDWYYTAYFNKSLQ